MASDCKPRKRNPMQQLSPLDKTGKRELTSLTCCLSTASSRRPERLSHTVANPTNATACKARVVASGCKSRKRNPMQQPSSLDKTGKRKPASLTCCFINSKHAAPRKVVAHGCKPRKRNRMRESHCGKRLQTPQTQPDATITATADSHERSNTRAVPAQTSGT